MLEDQPFSPSEAPAPIDNYGPSRSLALAHFSVLLGAWTSPTLRVTGLHAHIWNVQATTCFAPSPDISPTNGMGLDLSNQHGNDGTQCTPAQLEFHALGRRGVVGRFDGGRLTSDGGGVCGKWIGGSPCWIGWRAASRISAIRERSARAAGAGRAADLGIASATKMSTTTTAARGQPAGAVAGKADPTGAARARAGSRPCAGRIEHAEPFGAGRAGGGGEAPLQEDLADPAALDRLLVDVFLESRARAPEEIWLDLDATIPCTAIRRDGSSTATTATTCEASAADKLRAASSAVRAPAAGLWTGLKRIRGRSGDAGFSR